MLKQENKTIVNEENKTLNIEFKRRLDPDYIHVKNQIEKGILGKLHLIKMTNRHCYRTHPNPFLINIHEFDIVTFMMGEEVTEIYAMNQQSMHHNAVITLTMRDGAMAVIDTSSHANYGCDQRVEVFGEKGALLVENYAKTHIQHFTKTGIKVDMPSGKLINFYPDDFYFQLQTIVDASCQTHINITPNLKAALKIAKAAEKSAREHKVVTI